MFTIVNEEGFIITTASGEILGIPVENATQESIHLKGSIQTSVVFNKESIQTSVVFNAELQGGGS